MRLQIYLNENTRDSFFRGYDETDMMKLVYDGENPIDVASNEPLELVYEANQNHGDRRPWYEGRSLSKGDVIVVDDKKAYAIASVGFEEIAFLPILVA